MDHFLKNTNGVVVCGGQSQRMGTDKSLLVYHNNPQRYHICEMLGALCGNVFISCNESQSLGIEGFNIIKDDPAFSNTGPIAGLLSAFEKSEKDVLFIGCDYPYLTAEELSKFKEKCTGSRPVVFYNEQGYFEPLLGWYPYHCYERLISMFQNREYSLQHFLKEIDAVPYYPSVKKCMISVDTEEEYLKAKEFWSE